MDAAAVLAAAVAEMSLGRQWHAGRYYCWTYCAAVMARLGVVVPDYRYAPQLVPREMRAEYWRECGPEPGALAAAHDRLHRAPHHVLVCIDAQRYAHLPGPERPCTPCIRTNAQLIRDGWCITHHARYEP